MPKQKRKQKRVKPGTKSLAVVRNYFPNVEEVVDADEPLIVDVTRADNNNADVKKHRTCALAVACKRSTKADGVIVGLTTSYVIFGKTAYRYHNHQTTTREITSFDRKAGFEVGTYVMVPKPPAGRLGVNRGIETHPHNQNADRRKFRHFTGNVRTVLGAHEAVV